jgi:cardiolipin synthase
MAGVLLAVVGCASVPQVRTPSVSAASQRTIALRDGRGPLSRRQTAAVIQQLEHDSPNPTALARHLAIEQALAGDSLLSGNSVTVLRDGAQTFPAMFQALRAARRSVCLEYYIFEDVAVDGEHITDLLLERHAAGVDVALIYDAVGSSGTPNAVFEKLKAGGVRVLAFNPVNPLNAHGHWSINDRDHRKILVADDTVAIVGGINMSSTYESGPAVGSGGSGPSAGDKPAADKGTGDKAAADKGAYWRDTDVQIQGPAAAQLARLFRQHWQQQGGSPGDEVAPEVPGGNAGSEVIRILGSQPGALAPRYYAALLSAVRVANQRVWITTAYFVPTHGEMHALIAAARRGLDVRLLVPSEGDSGPALAVQRSTYGALLRAGVKIFERQGVILHTKCVVIDGVWTVIGSSNFDHRSVLFNDEVDAIVIGSGVAEDLERYFQEDVMGARAVQRTEWAHRSWRERAKEQFWKLSTRLL